MMPAEIPIVSAMTIAIEASCIVTGSFCSTRSSTFCLLRIDLPRSPESTPLTQNTYWIGIG